MAIASAQVPTAVLTDAGGATTGVSFSSLPTAGHGVIVYYTNAVAANPILDPTMADNQGVGNSYVKAIKDNDLNQGQMAAIWRCDAIGATSGTFTVTVTHNASSNNYSLINIQEVNSGITLDKTASSHTPVAGVTTVTATTLSSADELIATAYTEDTSGDHAQTVATGYTDVMKETNANLHISAQGAYKIVTVTTAPAAVWTTDSGATNAAAVLATFKPSAGGSDTNITPIAGTFSLSGIAPLVMRGTVVVPTVSSLVLSGNTPTVTKSNTDIKPNSAALSLSSSPPILIVSGSFSITPSVGSIILIGDTVTQTLTIPAPSATTLTLTGNAPVILRGTVIAASAGSLAFAGNACTIVTGNIQMPFAGTLSINGLVPSVSISGSIIIQPNAGDLSFSSNTSSLITNTIIVPTVRSLSIVGNAPTITTIGSVSVTPLAGALLFNGIVAQMSNSLIKNSRPHRNGFGFGFR